MSQYKPCITCGNTKSINLFRAGRNACKECTVLQDAKRYQDNKAKKQEKALAYYHANKEARSKYSSARYAQNKKEISDARSQKRRENLNHFKKLERASYQRNREQKRLQAKRHLQLNYEAALERNHRRRARLREAKTFKITARETKRLYGSTCLFCGSSEQINLDHIIPISRGGSHGIGNLQPLCDNCNSTKYNKTIMEWRMYRIAIGNPLELDRNKK
jgi:5-methylcytosine-specific restriction endonuclease McrA